MVFDEPINGLDYYNVQTFKEILFDLKNDGISILITSHDRYFLDEVCDLQYFIQNNTIVPMQKKQGGIDKKICVVLCCPHHAEADYGERDVHIVDENKDVISVDVLLNDGAFWSQIGEEIRVGVSKVLAIVEPQEDVFASITAKGRAK